MSDHEQNAQWRTEVLQRDILPLFFPAGPEEDSPQFVLLTGQPGAGRLRGLGPAGLRGVPVVNPDELQAFHPQVARLRAARASEAVEELASTAAGWVSGCIRHAREYRRSVVLDGAFPDPVVADAAAQRFTAAGFTTRVVVVGSRRAESLLTVASEYLQEVRASRPATLVTVEAHDAGLDASRRLTASLDESAWVNQATVITRSGQVAYDTHRQPNVPGFAGVAAALDTAQSERVNRWDATQWLSELHHVTDYATSLRTMPDGVGELLVELHETALREVIPELHVPTDGQFRSVIEQKTRARLVDLRRSLSPVPTVDAAAPVVVPGGPDVGRMAR